MLLESVASAGAEALILKTAVRSHFVAERLDVSFLFGLTDDLAQVDLTGYLVIRSEACIFVESVGKVCPCVSRAVSALSRMLEQLHGSQSFNDICAGKGFSELLFKQPVDDQRDEAGEEVRFDVVFKLQIYRS